MLEAALGYLANGREFVVAELVCPVVGVMLSVDGDCQTDVVDGAWCGSGDVMPVAVRDAFRRDAGGKRRQLVRSPRVPEPVAPLRVVHASRPEPNHAVVACKRTLQFYNQ